MQSAHKITPHYYSFILHVSSLKLTSYLPGGNFTARRFNRRVIGKSSKRKVRRLKRRGFIRFGQLMVLNCSGRNNAVLHPRRIRGEAGRNPVAGIYEAARHVQVQIKICQRAQNSEWTSVNGIRWKKEEENTNGSYGPSVLLLPRIPLVISPMFELLVGARP